MISNPKPGQRVQVWYAAKNLPMPHHGKFGTVVAVAKNRPKNHLIRMDDEQLVAVPAGNLREPK